MPAPDITEETFKTDKDWTVVARFTPAPNGRFAVSATADYYGPSPESNRAAPLRQIGPIEMQRSIAETLDEARQRVIDFIAASELGNVLP